MCTKCINVLSNIFSIQDYNMQSSTERKDGYSCVCGDLWVYNGGTLVIVILAFLLFLPTFRQFCI